MKEKTMTLGELIKKLESFDQDRLVVYDFCGFRPAYIDSWRGSYSMLALSFNGERNMNVSELLLICQNANGRTFTGYKGGQFLMNSETPVWVDNYGEFSETVILQLIDTGNDIIIETGYREY